MVRAMHVPGGESQITFGSEAPLLHMQTPAKQDKLTETPEKAPPTPEPVAEPVVPAEAIATDLEALKLKVIAGISKLDKGTPALEGLLSSFLTHLQKLAPATDSSAAADAALDNLKAALKARGTHGIISLGKKFKSMDDSGDNKLCFEEFKKALVEMKQAETDIHRLFRKFDADCNGWLSYDELLVGLRGSLSARRLDMVQRAFKVLDKTGDGKVTAADLKGRYDASRHPDVLLGTKGEDEVLAEFMSTFEAKGGGAKGDGVVTFDEFKVYYEGVSASIDLDDYFELVIRNAWHISGGEGWCANTTCKRVLVLHDDGSQTVQEIKDDFDIVPDQYLAKLTEQGVKGIKSVAAYGEPSDVPAGKPAEAAPPSSPSAGTPSSRPATATGRRANPAAFRSSIVFG